MAIGPRARHKQRYILELLRAPQIQASSQPVLTAWPWLGAGDGPLTRKSGGRFDRGYIPTRSPGALSTPGARRSSAWGGLQWRVTWGTLWIAALSAPAGADCRAASGEGPCAAQCKPPRRTPMRSQRQTCSRHADMVLTVLHICVTDDVLVWKVVRAVDLRRPRTPTHSRRRIVDTCQAVGCGNVGASSSLYFGEEESREGGEGIGALVAAIG